MPDEPRRDAPGPVPSPPFPPPLGAAGLGGGDQVQLRGMRFTGAHGALPGEKERPQPFEVDLDVFLDLSRAGAEDDLSLTVDYGRLCEAARNVVEGNPVTLLERLAELIASAALDACGGRAWRVVVTVRKLRPPVPVIMASAAVRICRP